MAKNAWTDFSDLEPVYGRWLPSDKNAAILDAGCGVGRMLAYLADFPNAIGVDINGGEIQKIPDSCRGRAKRIDRLDQFLDQNPGRFDLVIAKDMIYYFSHEEMIPMLERMRRALKPGGRIIVEAFNGAHVTGSYIMHKDRGIRRAFTEHSLKQTLEDAGFTIEFFGDQHFTGWGVRSMIARMAWFFWKLNLRMIFVAERGFDPQNARFLGKKIYAVARAK